MLRHPRHREACPIAVPRTDTDPGSIQTARGNSERAPASSPRRSSAARWRGPVSSATTSAAVAARAAASATGPTTPPRPAARAATSSSGSRRWGDHCAFTTCGTPLHHCCSRRAQVSTLCSSSFDTAIRRPPCGCTRTCSRTTGPKKNPAFLRGSSGGADGTRTRGLRRDRPTNDKWKEAMKPETVDTAEVLPAGDPKQGDPDGPFRGSLATPLLLSPSTLDPQGHASLLSVKQVAVLLHVCTRTVYQLVDRKEIPHFRIGSIIRFRMDELENWMVSTGRRP